MSDDINRKDKFREALDKKKNGKSHINKLGGGKPRVQGSQSTGRTQKMFRRKSGSN